MKKKVSFTSILSLLLIIANLSGCASSRFNNPAGVHGPESDFQLVETIPLAKRPTGGTEHPGSFAPVYFAFDSSQIAASERAKAERVARYLKQNRATSIIIEGHCDERGSREYNLALSERRALAVRAYLASLGIGVNRIQTKSYGEENPINPGHIPEAWDQNRCAEFVLYY